jgi:CMP-N-acetylneuraminic acid synthetase
MKICSLLLAKGNSSFKNKNIYPTLGRPLMAYPMLAAKNVNLISDCFISSDSKQYLKIGEKYGYIPILRSPELAQDSSKSDDVVLDSEWKEFRSPDFEEIKTQLKTPIIFDGRNQYNTFSL